jgi:lipoprotein-anchoring transpeptidase ErfK/SrfK
MLKNSRLACLSLISLLGLASCVMQAPPVDYLSGVGFGDAPQPQWREMSYWDDDGSPGKPWILVDLDRQAADFYRGKNLIGTAAISSGTEGRRTRPGNYTILEKKLDKHSTSYGHIEDASGRVVNNDATPKTPVPPGCRYVPAPMPYWMRLTNDGIGMHQGFLPGYPASHGCIRMDKAVVAKFFNAAHVGMPVKVVGTSGDWLASTAGFAD